VRQAVDRRRRAGFLAVLAISATLTGTWSPAADAASPPATVVPAANATVEGIVNYGWPFNCGFFELTSQRYQQVYAGSAVGSGLITSLAFRPDADFGGAFGPTTLPDVTVTLSTTAAPVDGLSLTFADNVGADVRTVHHGDLTLSSAATGPGPRDFDVVIPLPEPFPFDAGAGNLLLDVTVPSCRVTTQLDAELFTTETSRSYTFFGGSESPVAEDAGAWGLVTRFSFADEAAPTVSGGGWVNPAGSSRTHFTVDLAPGVTGALQVRAANNQQRFASDTVADVVAGGPGEVSWTGTGRWRGAAGYSYEVTVADRVSTRGKKADTIAVLVYRTGDRSDVVFSTGGPQPLGGGNLSAG
jgi:hypothetical protein